MLKSPPSLFTHLSSLPDNTTVGTLTFIKKPKSTPAVEREKKSGKKRKNEFVINIDTFENDGRRYKLSGITEGNVPAMHVTKPRESDAIYHDIVGTIVRSGGLEPDDTGYRREVGTRNRIFEENRANIVREERGAAEDDRRMISSRYVGRASEASKAVRTPVGPPWDPSNTP